MVKYLISSAILCSLLCSCSHWLYTPSGSTCPTSSDEIKVPAPPVPARQGEIQPCNHPGPKLPLAATLGSPSATPPKPAIPGSSPAGCQTITSCRISAAVSQGPACCPAGCQTCGRFVAGQGLFRFFRATQPFPGQK